jgi:hypothetical protein
LVNRPAHPVCNLVPAGLGAPEWVFGRYMFRALGMFGLGILFLLISPSLRGTLIGDFEAFTTFLEHNSPLSYVGLALVILAGLMFMVYRSSQPR